MLSQRSQDVDVFYQMNFRERGLMDVVMECVCVKSMMMS